MFIHIPKTAGNSIQNVLKYYSEDEIVCPTDLHDGVNRFGVINKNFPNINKHSSLLEYYKVLQPDVFHSLYKFAVIRNPWEIMISFFFSPHRQTQTWNRDEFIDLLEKVPTMFYYLNTNGLPSSKPEVNFVMRFESLENDFRKVSQILELENFQLPVRNKSNREDYWKYYDSELVDMVAHKYAAEIEYAGYSFCKPTNKFI
ncbi:MAG: sulfotransferase family protein [Okeania sp. SIO4D6]|nr:sulfotransferase family protein [Okeania sp. SIO4D6]NEP93285.1 sulfotransferase family protein [Okeania sp. SIO2F5]